MTEWVKNDSRGYALGCGAKAKEQFPEAKDLSVVWDNLDELPKQLDFYFDRAESARDCDLVLIKMPLYKYHILTVYKFPYFYSITAFGETKQNINKYDKFEKTYYKRK